MNYSNSDLLSSALFLYKDFLTLQTGLKILIYSGDVDGVVAHPGMVVGVVVMVVTHPGMVVGVVVMMVAHPGMVVGVVVMVVGVAMLIWLALEIGDDVTSVLKIAGGHWSISHMTAHFALELVIWSLSLHGASSS